jgi:DNA-binding HxlR family transcriptional regulator
MVKFELCPRYELAIALLGKRWTGLIIKVLLSGPQRFTDLVGVIPNLSAKMLTERMKELEKEGIVLRKVYPETPVKIEYVLTPKGRELAPALEAIQSWATKWIKLPSAPEPGQEAGKA